MALAQLHLDVLPLSSWAEIKGRKFIIAGPCGAESEQQVMETARGLADSGLVGLFRAGVWKPRTRPGAFEGFGEKALPWLQKVKQETGLPVAVEVANATHVELALKYGVDVLWIGARTTVNPFSVQEIADAVQGLDIPVLIKNPVHPDLALWVGAIERVNRAGIKKIAAIHRGFHTGTQTVYRNAPLWEMAIDLKSMCPGLPVICDPSHIGGRRDLIPDLAQRALDLQMDGLMIEVHPNPAVALSDAAQQFTPQKFIELIHSLIFREAAIDNEDFDENLRVLRKVIDGIDEDLIQALARRLDVVQKIGTYKKEHGVTILQIDRWLEILRSRTAQGEALGIDSEIMVELCQLLHKASIRKQTETMNRLVR